MTLYSLLHLAVKDSYANESPANWRRAFVFSLILPQVDLPYPGVGQNRDRLTMASLRSA